MEAHDRHKNVVISGIPGVGKSTFRNDVVHCLVQKMKRGGPIYTVVLHSSPARRGVLC
jgi:nucleoside-triphosphatase THEP1